MATNFQVEGLVLHTRDFGEKDALLTLLSKERGKLSIICKGVKKPVSRMRASAQLFSHARFFLYEGKSISTATQAETLESFKTLSTDLNKFAVASYWAELTELLLPEKEMNFHVYLLLLKALRLLDKSFSWSLFYAYQIKLLILTGYEPVIESCVVCSGELSGLKFLSPSQGGVMCGLCANGLKSANEGVIQSLRLFKTAPLETITKLKISDTVKRDLHKFIKDYIEYHTENRLRSAEFLNSVE